MLLYRLMLELGIDCRVITGIGNGGAHAWNIVELGGLYYNADATWDSSYYTGIGTMPWRLRANDTFGNHTRDEEFDTDAFNTEYPMSETDYKVCAAHEFVSVVTEATCTEGGYTTYTCTQCGDGYVGGLVDATGHQHTEIRDTKEVTCTEDGYTGDTWCTDCETKLSNGEVIQAPGHSYTSEVIAPTCTEQGYTTHICSACGYSHQDSYVDATGHQHTEVRDTKAVTCTEDGYTGDTWCTDCETKISNGEVIEATGHSYTSVVTAPTCTKQGYTTHSCACGHSYVGDYVDATGHQHTEIRDTKEVTCTEDGYTGDTWCTDCETKISNGEVIEATGHSYTSVVTAPTCTEQGYTTHSCACGHSYVGDYVDATGHQHTEVRDTKAVTCTEDGYTGDTWCTDCNAFIVEGEVIQAPGHSYTSVVTAPTCTEQGYTTHTCACGHSYTDGYVDALGHTYEDGYCTECGASERILGDVNNDGAVDIRDAVLVASAYNEVISLTEDQKRCADVNGDGAVDIRDAVLIASRYNEIIDHFPAEE